MDLALKRDPVREERSKDCLRIGRPSKTYLNDIKSRRGEDWDEKY
jgi:hypothetical protein